MDRAGLEAAVERKRLMQAVEAKRAAEAPKLPPQDPGTPWHEDFRRGMAESTLKTVLGGYELLGGELEPTTKKAMDLMRQDVEGSGGWGTAGNVTGELAQLALPASWIAKGAKGAGLGAKGILAADVALAGAHGGLKLPDEGKTRTEGAIIDATGATLGGAAGGVLRKAVQGINVKEAGKRLLDKGVYMTPASVSESTLPRGIEYAMQITPFLSKGVAKAKNKSNESWNMLALNNASPLGKVTKTGVEGVKQLQSKFNDAYTAAWAKAQKPSTGALVDILDEGQIAAKQLGGTSEFTLNKVMKDIAGLDGEDFTTAGLKGVDNALRKAIDTAGKNGDVVYEPLQSMKSKLRDAVGDEATNALKAVDSKYGDYKAIIKSGSALEALKNKGTFTPDTFMGGVKSAGSDVRAATGKAPLYKLAEDVMETAGQKSPSPIMDFLKGWAVNTPTLAPLETIGQTLLGKTAPQKLLQRPYNSAVAEALRNAGLRGSIVGSALQDESFRR